MWLSLVERYVRDVEAGGSNPLTSTIRLSLDAIRVWTLCFYSGRLLAPEATPKVIAPAKQGGHFCNVHPVFYSAFRRLSEAKQRTTRYAGGEKELYKKSHQTVTIRMFGPIAAER